MFGAKNPVWVNVDKPTKKCTIHSGQSCTFVKKWVPKMPTPYKSLGLPLSRDGGWIEFGKLGDAEKYCRKEFSDYTVVKHC